MKNFYYFYYYYLFQVLLSINFVGHPQQEVN